MADAVDLEEALARAAAPRRVVGCLLVPQAVLIPLASLILVWVGFAPEVLGDGRIDPREARLSAGVGVAMFGAGVLVAALAAQLVAAGTSGRAHGRIWWTMLAVVLAFVVTFGVALALVATSR